MCLLFAGKYILYTVCKDILKKIDMLVKNIQ